MEMLFMSQAVTILGSIIVAIITLFGTWIINNHKSTKEYEIHYQEILIKKQLETIEQIYQFLQNFRIVTDMDGWYPWMKDYNRLISLIDEQERISSALIWFPKEFNDLMTYFGNRLRDYQKGFPQYAVARDTQTLKHNDDYSDEIKLRAVEIEKAINDYLISGEPVVEVFKRNKAVLENVLRQHSGYKK